MLRQYEKQMGPPCFWQPHFSLMHATRRAQCRHKSGDCGYYNLHRDVNNSLPLHNSQLSIINYLIVTCNALLAKN